MQRNLEDAQSALYPKRILLCDRGTIDGAAYWSDDPAGLFEATGSSLEHEFAAGIDLARSGARESLVVLPTRPLQLRIC